MSACIIRDYSLLISKSLYSIHARIITLATSKAFIMPPIIRNILSVIAGIAIGSAVNMFIVLISGKFIPPPAGADVTTIEGLKASLHLFQPQHFLFPFLAHAVGTLAGALIAVKLTVGSRLRAAIIISLVFLAGGISNAVMLPAPLWFIVVDLVGAYLPMAYLALVISGVNRPGKVNH